ncbi:MAG TPA: hypothetical protein VFK40_04240 [Nitrososphaeraceae archaeon]|nr:hypothetical protein [Nitrososphaeraceae archaeon]
MTITKSKSKNMFLFALISTTFILSIVSHLTPLQSQQAFGQGAFQIEDDDQSPPQLTIEETNNDTNQAETTTTTDNNNQKIILGEITIPITSDTQLSLEIPDSKITVEPNK